jgi:hypothetical protein
MGLFISLQKENGSQIEGIADHTNILHRVLPQEGDAVLSGIDWYGDTVFNGQQMTQFLPAWKTMKAAVKNQDELALLSAIEGLAERCANGTHLYLKFIGD